MIELKLPNKNMLNLIKQGVDEIKNNPCEFDTHAVKSFIGASNKNMDTYFDNLEKERKGIDLTAGMSPQTEFWLFDGDKFIGFLAIRHIMTDIMLLNGVGHIGYEIIPSMRQKGYVKKGLKLLLDYAKNTLHLDEIILTCFEKNVPSCKTALRVMHQYGGYEMEPILIKGQQKRRFVIKTEEISK